MKHTYIISLSLSHTYNNNNEIVVNGSFSFHLVYFIHCVYLCVLFVVVVLFICLSNLWCMCKRYTKELIFFFEIYFHNSISHMEQRIICNRVSELFRWYQELEESNRLLQTKSFFKLVVLDSLAFSCFLYLSHSHSVSDRIVQTRN